MCEHKTNQILVHQVTVTAELQKLIEVSFQALHRLYLRNKTVYFGNSPSHIQALKWVTSGPLRVHFSQNYIFMYKKVRLSDTIQVLHKQYI